MGENQVLRDVGGQVGNPSINSNGHNYDMEKFKAELGIAAE